MRLICGWFGLLGLAGVPGLGAQSLAEEIRGRWSLGISIGSAAFSGASRQSAPSEDHPSFTPYGPTMGGLRVGYGRERLRFGITARYGQPGVQIRGVPAPDEGRQGSAVALLIENAYHLSTFTGTVSTRLSQLQRGPSLRASVGVGIERWAAPGAPIRTIGGGQVGLALEADIGGGFVAAAEAEVGFTPASPFRMEELPEGYEPRGTWRKSLAGALAWRF